MHTCELLGELILDIETGTFEMTYSYHLKRTIDCIEILTRWLIEGTYIVIQKGNFQCSLLYKITCTRFA